MDACSQFSKMSGMSPFHESGVYIQMTETVRDAYVAHDGYVSDKWSSYLTVYEELFSALKTKPIRLLEIGVQNGGSLQIWRRYFPNAVAIVGCDFDPRVAKLRPGPKIHLVVGDITSASTVESIKRVCPEYDIVIDDGSHRSEHIIAAFQQLFPLVAPGGLFIAEDLHCSYWKSHNGRLLAPFSSIEFFKRLIDAINYDHWRNERQQWTLSSLFAPLSTRRLKKLPLAELHRQVRSVRFYNSMCIVEKASGEVGVGQRLLAGDNAIVEDSMLKATGVQRLGTAGATPPTR